MQTLIDIFRKVEFFMVKGYKALDEDMNAIHGDEMQYELEKWYEVDGEIKPCENGFHFCKKLEDTHWYYNLFESRLFEIEADEEVMEAGDTKMVCSKIRPVREILPEEWQTEENLLKILKISGLAIQYIKSPTIEMQLEAVKQNEWVIQYIKNSTVEVQLEAVKQNGWAIQYIKNSTVEVQLEAVKQNGWAIQFIKNPTVEVQLEAVKQNGWAIRCIKNPIVEVQLEAVKQDGYAIQLIEKPAPEVLTYLQKKQ